MNDTINERIRSLIQSRNLSANAMANKLGVAGTVIYNIIGQRKSKPSFDLLHTISQTFDDVNPDWLLTGEGDMYRATPPAAPSSPSEKVFPIVIDRDNREQISLVPIYAQAGYMRGFEDPEFIRSLPLAGDAQYEDGTYRDFEIKGDSMENYFFERDVIRAKYLPQLYWEQRLRLGELFVILHRTDGVVFKQMVDHQVATGEITLHSFNDYYEDYSINLRDVDQLWYYTEYRSSRKFTLVR